MLIFDIIKKHAEERGDKVAITIEDTSISYKELYQKILLKYLEFKKYCKLSSHPVITIILDNSIEFIENYLASTIFPFCCSVIDPNLPSFQMEEILKKLNPTLIILDKDNLSVDFIVNKLRINKKYINDKIKLISDDEINRLSLGGHNHPFLVGFTSGTTSIPKAFIRRTFSWRKSFELSTEVFKVSEANHIFCPCPLFHGIGLYCLNETLYAGKTFYGLKSWDKNKAIKMIKECNIDRLVIVPSMLFLINNGLINKNDKLQNVKHIITAGAKLDINNYKIIQNKFPNATVQEYYGASELGFVCSSDLNDNKCKNILSVGKPFNSVELLILDDNLNKKETGEVGTIYIKSDLIIERYLWGDINNEFNKHFPLVTVGDIGYIDEEGLVYVIGRKGGMIQSGGFNIYLSEIENSLNNYDDIKNICIIALEDDCLGHKIVAILMNDNLDFDKFYQFCQKKLPYYKIPKDFYLLSQFPMTSTGKINIKILKEMILNNDKSLIKLSTRH